MALAPPSARRTSTPLGKHVEHVGDLEGDRLERGSDKVRAGCVPRVIPLISPRASAFQCGEPRPANAGTNVTPPARVDRARQPLALGSVGEDAESVAQPLDRGAAREDRALERIAAGRSHRLEQPCRYWTALRSGVRQHEAARPVGRLRLAAAEAAVAEEGRLLVACDARDRHGHAEQLRLADDLGRAHEPRQQSPVDAEQVEQLVRPVERVEVEEHRSGRVGQVGDVHPAAGQLPDEPRVDRPERELVARRVRAREQPLELRGGEVRIGNEAGSCPDQLGVELAAALGGAPVLPDDRGSDGRCPSARSQRTVVSRWFAIPIASQVRGADRGSPDRVLGGARGRKTQISSGSCSTQPGCGKCCGSSR